MKRPNLPMSYVVASVQTERRKSTEMEFRVVPFPARERANIHPCLGAVWCGLGRLWRSREAMPLVAAVQTSAGAFAIALAILLSADLFRYELPVSGYRLFSCAYNVSVGAFSAMLVPYFYMRRKATP